MRDKFLYMDEKSKFLYDVWQSCTSSRQKEFMLSFLLAIGNLDAVNVVNNQLPDVVVKRKVKYFSDEENPIKVIQELFGVHVTVSSESEVDISEDIAVFEREQLAFDSESKRWVIRLWSSSLFDELYFRHVQIGEMEEIGRLFLDIWDMRSQYGVSLYFYLVSKLSSIPSDSNGFAWTVSVDVLKEILGCDTQEHYKEYKYFHNDVLKKAAEDIQSSSKLEFQYEQIKEARRVVLIKFTVYRDER